MLAVLAALGLWIHTHRTANESRNAVHPLRELRMDELIKLEDRMHAAGEAKPFTGRLYENFSTLGDSTTLIRKLEIDIRDGKAHGRSVGYFKDGKPEVEEFFIEGVSDGLRTRWSPEGWKKSEERIEHGKLNGTFIEWHGNGTKALEMTLMEGKPDGTAEAWHPDGQIKSRTRFESGKIIERVFFPERAQETVSTVITDSP